MGDKRYVRINGNSPRQQAKARGVRGFYISVNAPKDAKGKCVPFRKKDYSQIVLDAHDKR